MVLVHVFPLTGDSKHLFMHRLAIFISSWRNVFSGLLSLFELGYLFFPLLTCICSLHLYINHSFIRQVIYKYCLLSPSAAISSH